MLIDSFYLTDSESPELHGKLTLNLRPESEAIQSSSFIIALVVMAAVFILAVIYAKGLYKRFTLI